MSKNGKFSTVCRLSLSDRRKKNRVLPPNNVRAGENSNRNKYLHTILQKVCVRAFLSGGGLSNYFARSAYQNEAVTTSRTWLTSSLVSSSESGFCVLPCCILLKLVQRCRSRLPGVLCVLAELSWLTLANSGRRGSSASGCLTL